jgi:hypothetical protein
LSRKKSKPKTPAEQVRESVEEALTQAKASGRRLLADAPDTSQQLERAFTDLRRRIERGRGADQNVAHEVAEQVRRWGRSVDRSRHHEPTTAQQVAAQAAAAAVERAERALGAGAQLADTARDQAQRWGEDVVPAVRDIATQAAEAALERWNELREHAPEIHPPDARRELRHIESNAVDLARGTGAAVAERAAGISRRAAEATEHTLDRARDASKKGTEAVSHVRDASVRTAEATVESGKNSGAVLFWAGAATGLIFFVLLNEERRQQILGTVQALINDIQGYDDEF